MATDATETELADLKRRCEESTAYHCSGNGARIVQADCDLVLRLIAELERRAQPTGPGADELAVLWRRLEQAYYSPGFPEIDTAAAEKELGVVLAARRSSGAVQPLTRCPHGYLNCSTCTRRSPEPDRVAELEAELVAVKQDRETWWPVVEGHKGLQAELAAARRSPGAVPEEVKPAAEFVIGYANKVLAEHSTPLLEAAVIVARWILSPPAGSDAARAGSSCPGNNECRGCGRVWNECVCPPAGSADGWRDIATAPKDGTPILGFCGKYRPDFEKTCWSGSQWIGGDGGWSPTHWQPLPPAPGHRADDSPRTAEGAGGA